MRRRCPAPVAPAAPGPAAPEARARTLGPPALAPAPVVPPAFADPPVFEDPRPVRDALSPAGRRARPPYARYVASRRSGSASHGLRGGRARHSPIDLARPGVGPDESVVGGLDREEPRQRRLAGRVGMVGLRETSVGGLHLGEAGASTRGPGFGTDQVRWPSVPPSPQRSTWTDRLSRSARRPVRVRSPGSLRPTIRPCGSSDAGRW